MFQLFIETMQMKPRFMEHRQVQEFGHTDNAHNIHSRSDSFWFCIFSSN